MKRNFARPTIMKDEMRKAIRQIESGKAIGQAKNSFGSKCI